MMKLASLGEGSFTERVEPRHHEWGGDVMKSSVLLFVRTNSEG